MSRSGKKKLLITGSLGMLGGNIAFELKNRYEIFGMDKCFPDPELKNQFKIDLTKKDEISKVICEIEPDLVIHCAALTNVDFCEDNYELARITNALAVRDLVRSLDARSRFIYISTDSVFDGKKGDYSESDPPSPLNHYAKTKLEGEWFVEQESLNYSIIRTNIFGVNRIKGESFAEWVYNSLRRKQAINMFTDVIFSPITVTRLTFFIEKLLNSDFIGRINIGTENPISKYDFGAKMAGFLGLDVSLIKPASVDMAQFKARRPKNTSLNLKNAESIIGSMPKIEDEIQQFCLKNEFRNI